MIFANFDGASVNLGQKGGVIAKIRDVIPDVMGLHCVAHKLELAAHDATKSYKYLEQMESTIKGLFSFYHYSPRRKNEVKAIAEILDVEEFDGVQVFQVSFTPICIISSGTTHRVMFEMSCDSFQILFQCTDSSTFVLIKLTLKEFSMLLKMP
jgi:hypothetical protein